MSLADELVHRQFVGNVVFGLSGGFYLGGDLRLSNTPFTWVLRRGDYHGRFSGRRVDISGYWIFRHDARKCWQAVHGGGDALVFWNEDGKAGGDPQDWELFSFKLVDSGSNKVTIHTSHSQSYVHQEGGIFHCRGAARDAVHLTVTAA